MIRLSTRAAVSTALVAGSLFGVIATVAGASILGSSVFPDVPRGSYFDAAVGELYNDGVIKGGPDGNYRPGDSVSRADIAVMFKRFKDSLDTTTVTRSSSSRSSKNSSESSSSSSSSSVASTPTTNAAGIFRFTTSTFSVNENAGTVNITIVRTGGNQGTVTVDYAVAGGTATAGTDFEASTAKLTFAPKETSKTFTVRILDDANSEGTEAATITLTNPTNGAIIAAPGTATISIIDNETSASLSSGASTSSSSSTNPNGTLSLSAATYGVLENVGTLTVTVSRTGGSTGAVGITYGTTNGSAVSGAEYSTANGTLSFAAGETSKTFTIAIADDIAVDGAKSFTISLTNPTGSPSLGTTSALATIYDNESDGTFGTGSLKLLKSSYDVLEGDKKVVMTIQRVAGTLGTVSVNYTTTNGVALAGADYTFTSGTLTFAPGESSKTVTIPIVDDSNLEEGDYFLFELSNPTSNATLISPATATVNIFD